MDLNRLEEEEKTALSTFQKIRMGWSNFIYTTCFTPTHNPFHNELNDLMIDK